jgi:hypothetical protein
VVYVERQLYNHISLGRGAWLALAASAALVIGTALRLREFRLD